MSLYIKLSVFKNLLFQKKKQKYHNNFPYIMPALKSDFNSAKNQRFFLSHLAGSRALPSGDITGIIRNRLAVLLFYLGAL